MIRRIRVDLPSPLSPITMADGAGTADGDATAADQALADDPGAQSEHHQEHDSGHEPRQEQRTTTIAAPPAGGTAQDRAGQDESEGRGAVLALAPAVGKTKTRGDVDEPEDADRITRPLRPAQQHVRLGVHAGRRDRVRIHPAQASPPRPAVQGRHHGQYDIIHEFFLPLLLVVLVIRSTRSDQGASPGRVSFQAGCHGTPSTRGKAPTHRGRACEEPWGVCRERPPPAAVPPARPPGTPPRLTPRPRPERPPSRRHKCAPSPPPAPRPRTRPAPATTGPRPASSRPARVEAPDPP